MANFTPQEIEEILQQFFDVTGKRQYIGARYIPIFGRKDEQTIQWDGGVAPYEPLTIVLHQGNSYTSRTYVPIGVDILNQDYWALTGNYNAQVEQYRTETLQLVDNVNRMESIIPATDFDSTNTVKKYIDDTATQLQTDVNTALEVIPATDFDSTNTVKKYIDSSTQLRGDWQGANVICVTDSWGSEGNSHGVTTSWMHQVCNTLGANFIDLHQGNTGYCKPPTFETRLLAWATANPDLVNNINYILVCGSCNDYSYTYSQIMTAVGSFLTNCIPAFPNATFIILPAFAGIDFSKGDPANASVNLWRHPILSVQAYFLNHHTQHVVFIPDLCYTLVGRPNSFMDTDFVHPTQLGHDLLADTFLARMYGFKNADFYLPLSGNASYNSVTPTWRLDNETTRRNIATPLRNSLRLDGTNLRGQILIKISATTSTGAWTKFKLGIPKLMAIQDEFTLCGTGLMYKGSDGSMSPCYVEFEQQNKNVLYSAPTEEIFEICVVPLDRIGVDFTSVTFFMLDINIALVYPLDDRV